jgi:glycine/D-amino acid oxidase-like deaminating enzyme
MHNGGVSFWWDQIGIPSARPALGGDLDVDVCIVGGGYTGLWTAYYLKLHAPDVRVAVLDKRFAGFGASGRNGGWLTNSITGGREHFVAEFGRALVGDWQRRVNETVDEVITVCKHEKIDADIVKGGEYNVAMNSAQQARLEAWAADEATWPMADAQLLSREEALERIAISGTTGAIWHPHAARIQPAKLAAGLADACERLGVQIFENTTVTEITPGRARTSNGTIRADFVIRATEGFTANFAQYHRAWLPMNSSLVVTEPLSANNWQNIGWEGREVVGDMAHGYFYAQRTADDRIAIGGRGKPYRFGSKTDNDGSTSEHTVEKLRSLLARLFPVLAGPQSTGAGDDIQLAHAWSGVLGVPRDWSATVGLDTKSGLGWAGGYVGTGVTSTNLAGRTLADLVLRRETDITSLPWVNHRVRNWEVEPLRWTAVHALYAMYGMADRSEARGRASTSPLASLADAISGRVH